MADDLRHWLALRGAPGFGHVRIRRLADSFENARAIFTASETEKNDVLSKYGATYALEGIGFYYNEVLGRLSTASLTLRAYYAVTAAPTQFPPALLDQLGEGGIAIAPVGGMDQRLVRFEKRSGKISAADLIGVIFVPLV